MGSRRFLDTNILLYSISLAPAEASKRDPAVEILRQDGCCLSVQVLSEFYVQATRPTRAHRLTHDRAAGFVTAWTRFEVQDNPVAVSQSAFEIKARHGFSYWDCAILAAAGALGCSELMTADLSHGATIAGVTIVNPFR